MQQTQLRAGPLSATTRQRTDNKRKHTISLSIRIYTKPALALHLFKNQACRFQRHRSMLGNQLLQSFSNPKVHFSLSTNVNASIVLENPVVNKLGMFDQTMLDKDSRVLVMRKSIDDTHIIKRPQFVFIDKVLSSMHASKKQKRFRFRSFL